MGNGKTPEDKKGKRPPHRIWEVRGRTSEDKGGKRKTLEDKVGKRKVVRG